jgi:hypothetical protein
MSTLKHEGGNEYVLKDDSCWITVHNLSIYIRPTDEGVAVDIFPLGKEAEESVAGTWALYSEGEEDEQPESEESLKARQKAFEEMSNYE